MRVGDNVRVKGGTRCGSMPVYECLPIGTICKIIMKRGTSYLVAPLEGNGDKVFWYAEKALEKGSFRWVPEADDRPKFRVRVKEEDCSHGCSGDLTEVLEYIAENCGEDIRDTVADWALFSEEHSYFEMYNMRVTNLGKEACL